LARTSAGRLCASPLLILPFVTKPRRARTLATVMGCHLPPKPRRSLPSVQLVRQRRLGYEPSRHKLPGVSKPKHGRGSPQPALTAKGPNIPVLPGRRLLACRLHRAIMAGILMGVKMRRGLGLHAGRRRPRPGAASVPAVPAVGYRRRARGLRAERTAGFRVAWSERLIRFDLFPHGARQQGPPPRPSRYAPTHPLPRWHLNRADDAH
jgi:hypothetical protein